MRSFWQTTMGLVFLAAAGAFFWYFGSTTLWLTLLLFTVFYVQDEGVREIRGQLDGRLNRLEAQIDALQATLDHVVNQQRLR